MESLITKKTMDDKHQDALREDTLRDEAIEALDKPRTKKYNGRKANYVQQEVPPEIVKNQVIRIDIPVDQLLAANRESKKQFFNALIKDVRARLAFIKEERGL